MRTFRFAMIASVAASLFFARVATAQAPIDVPKDHWAYPAVDDLASKGLIKGYPPSGSFLGKRTVTRYEMATILQRILARVDDLLSKKADKSKIPTIPAPQKAEPAPSGVSPEHLAEIKKLVDEFRTELTVIGTNMEKVKAELESLGQKVNDHGTAIGDLRTDVDNIKQGLEGAINATSEQAAKLDKVTGGKADAGFGKIKIGGLLQAWVIGEKNSPDKGQFNSFRLRRAEIKLTGTMSPKSYWTAMIDPAKASSLNVTSSGGNVTGVSINQTSNILQDMFVGFTLRPGFALEVGQQKVPLSFEGQRSSGQLLTVERALFNTLPVNNGRVGDIRDTGAMFRYNSTTLDAQVGVFDDGGNRQNQLDDSNRKELMYHLQYKGIPKMMLGVYQSASGGIGAANALRNRQGVEGTYTLGKHQFEAEAVQGRDGDPRVRSVGGFALYGYTINPTWEIILRGEYWNPNRDGHGSTYADEKDFTFGINYYLNGHHSKIQFNVVRKNINGTAPSFLGKDRTLFLTNFQQYF